MSFRELLESRVTRRTKFSTKIDEYRTPKQNVSYDFEHYDDGGDTKGVVVYKYVYRKRSGEFELEWDVSLGWDSKERPTVGDIITQAEDIVSAPYYEPYA